MSYDDKDIRLPDSNEGVVASTTAVVELTDGVDEGRALAEDPHRSVP
jgi:hypothetical protein